MEMDEFLLDCDVMHSVIKEEKKQLEALIKVPLHVDSLFILLDR